MKYFSDFWKKISNNTQLWPGPAQATADIWGMKQWVENFSAHLSLSLCNSDLQVKYIHTYINKLGRETIFLGPAQWVKLHLITPAYYTTMSSSFSCSTFNSVHCLHA